MTNTTNNMQTQTSSALHNAIMEAGGKDRPLRLAPAPETPIIDGTNRDNQTRQDRIKESYTTVSEEIRKKMDAKAEAVQIILIGMDNDIYFTVDACPNAIEMWKAIERLKQDDGTLDLYYSRFYKMMNELVTNQCIVTNRQVNVQSLLQLKPEWHRAQRLACTANPLALVAQHQSAYQPQANPSKYTQSLSTRSQSTTRNKGKAIVNPPLPTYNSEPEAALDDILKGEED
ncbi:hypothetical protein Tco_0432314 [Tanacetum coccineum]